jgi:hypothetical protein
LHQQLKNLKKDEKVGGGEGLIKVNVEEMLLKIFQQKIANCNA